MFVKALFSFLLLCFSAPVVYGQTKYVKSIARPHDDVEALLIRYRLERQECNFTEFFRLNKLVKNAGLKAGKTYFLPLKIVAWDKKSVKTSLKITSDDVATKVNLYNARAAELGLRAKTYKQDAQIWVPHSFLNCADAGRKVAPKTSTYEIFGKKHSTVERKDNVLSGAVYYLISGHGGPDPGAYAIENKKMICEDEYAYDVTLRLAKSLIEHGALVYIIVRDPNDGIRSGEYLKSDTDEKCYLNQKIPVNQKSRLTQRTTVINKLFAENKKKGYRYQRVVEIHVDSRNKKQRIDLFFYHHPLSDPGRQFSLNLWRVIRDKYKVFRKGNDYDGVVEKRDLHTLRESKPVSTFIELGNIRNASDRKRITSETNRQLLANWLTDGLLRDYEV